MAEIAKEEAKGIKRCKRRREKAKEKEFDIGEVPLESKISRTLGERMTKTVIVLILTTLFILPLFELETYYSATSSFETGLEELVSIHDTEGNSATY